MKLLIADCRLQIARRTRAESNAHIGDLVAYIDKLLAAFPRTEGQGLGTELNISGSSVLSPQSSALVEPLTDRELEVLRLLAEGRDNAEIAGALVVAVSTVKSHVNHIFGKLGVRNRLEAALRARQLNLL